MQRKDTSGQKRKATSPSVGRETEKKRRKVSEENSSYGDVSSESITVDDFFGGPKRSRAGLKTEEDKPKPSNKVQEASVKKKEANSELEKKQAQWEAASKEVEKLHEIRKAIGMQPKDRALCEAVLSVAESIIDELTLEVCFEMHKKLKTGRICTKCSSRMLADGPTDIFGTNPNNYVAESVTCLNIECERPMAASRYAPHLEKCLKIKTRGTGNRTRYVDYDDDKIDDLS